IAPVLSREIDPVECPPAKATLSPASMVPSFCTVATSVTLTDTAAPPLADVSTTPRLGNWIRSDAVPAPNPTPVALLADAYTWPSFVTSATALLTMSPWATPAPPRVVADTSPRTVTVLLAPSTLTPLAYVPASAATVSTSSETASSPRTVTALASLPARATTSPNVTAKSSFPLNVAP